MFVLILLIALSLTCPSYADVPRVMNFQGKATDTAGNPLNGAYGLTFRIYDAETGGNLEWDEAHNDVTITNGIFHVLLGETKPLGLGFDEGYWLSIEIGGAGEMSPRTRLASVGYASKAHSLAEEPVIPFYKKGFEIESVDSENIRIAPGVMEVAGKMFTTTAYSGALNIGENWIPGSDTSSPFVYAYAYDNSSTIGFKFSDEMPDLSDHLGNREGCPLLYQRYPDEAGGIYYRYIGNIIIDSAGKIVSVAEPPSLIFPTFSGEGKDGDINITEDTNFSDLPHSTGKRYLHANNFTITAGKTLTVDTGWAYIGVKGACTINGTISADGEGQAGGGAADGGGAGEPGKDASGEAGQVEALGCLAGSGGGGGGSSGTPGGSGGGGGANGGSGGSGNAGGDGEVTPVSTTQMLMGRPGHRPFLGQSPFLAQILDFTGAGGGSGGASGSSDSGGRGGAGGGIIYIECGTLAFNGTLTANGAGGSDGTGSGGAGGGGGGGGVIIIRSRIVDDDSGNVSVAGGSGGSGGYSGGNGANGFATVILVQ